MMFDREAREDREELRRWLWHFHIAGQCDPGCCWCNECPGHDRGGKRQKCCELAGEYNGFGSDGPLLFDCPTGCSCHD